MENFFTVGPISHYIDDDGDEIVIVRDLKIRGVHVHKDIFEKQVPIAEILAHKGDSIQQKTLAYIKDLSARIDRAFAGEVDTHDFSSISDREIEFTLADIT